MPAMEPQGTVQSCLRGPVLRAPHFLVGRCAAEDVSLVASISTQHKGVTFLGTCYRLALACF